MLWFSCNEACKPGKENNSCPKSEMVKSFISWYDIDILPKPKNVFGIGLYWDQIECICSSSISASVLNPAHPCLMWKMSHTCRCLFSTVSCWTVVGSCMWKPSFSRAYGDKSSYCCVTVIIWWIQGLFRGIILIPSQLRVLTTVQGVWVLALRP